MSFLVTALLRGRTRYDLLLHCVITFCLIQIASRHLTEFAYLACSIPVFFLTESRISAVIGSIAHSSSDFYRFPLALIPVLMILLTISIAGLYLFRHSPLSADFSLSSSYIQSLILSVSFFSFASGFRCVYILAYRGAFRHIFNEILGLFERVFILVRNFVLFFVWFPSLRNSSLVYIFTSLKIGLAIWQIFNLCVAGRHFYSNRSAVWESVPESAIEDICCVCQDWPKVPVRLRCGHICCFGCLDTWLASKSECPMCRRPTGHKKRIEFADGSLPPEVLLAAF
jgi:hypothetical protein